MSHSSKEEVFVKGKALEVRLVPLPSGQVVQIAGRFVRVGRLRNELHEDLLSPESLIGELKKTANRPDVFTFWQRPPETEPKYNYRMDLEAMSVLPISDYQHWLDKQVPKETRKNIRKSENRGVSIVKVACDDDLIRGIVEIYNETPVKRGKKFWHYGKDFQAVKSEVSRDLERSEFVCAYFQSELIGFYKIVYDDKLAHPVLSISKMAHRDKKTDDALIAGAVRACEQKGTAFFTYGPWRRGGHADFLRRHGFERMLLPRYYVPLTAKGSLVLALGLHRGLYGPLPEKLKLVLLDLRRRWYETSNTKHPDAS